VQGKEAQTQCRDVAQHVAGIGQERQAVGENAGHQFNGKKNGLGGEGYGKAPAAALKTMLVGVSVQSAHTASISISRI
jgi:hypothetical protein